MITYAAALLALPIVDSCPLPDIGVDVSMRLDRAGDCVATVRYLSPARDVTYSATDWGGSSPGWVVGTLSPALGFVDVGEFSESVWVSQGVTWAEFDTSFAAPEWVRVDESSCTCL